MKYLILALTFLGMFFGILSVVLFHHWLGQGAFVYGDNLQLHFFLGTILGIFGGGIFVMELSQILKRNGF